MKTRKIINILTAASVLAAVPFNQSCSDFLDIVPDGTATIEHAFKKRTQAERYLYGTYGFLPIFAHPANNPAYLAGGETWLFNDFSAFGKNGWFIANGQQGTQAPLMNYWVSVSGGDRSDFTFYGGRSTFTGIRDCNIFLENIHNTIDLASWERDVWIAEIKVLKAYLHFWLFRMYGPIPTIDQNIEIDVGTQETMYYREPVDDVVEFIVRLLDEAAEDLPLVIEDVTLDLGRFTKPIALAIKAQTLVLAASPLFNGNPEYVDVKDNRGLNLFPQSYDPQKWERAAKALEEAIEVAHEAGHDLFDMAEVGEVVNLVSPETLVRLQTKGAATERWNKEIIWGATYNDTSVLQRFGMPAFIYWNTYSGVTTRSYSPTIATVKEFYTKNGVPIEEDIEWQGVDPYELRTADNSHRYYIQPGHRTINLHFDREPRFYGSIAFDGAKFYGLGVLSDSDMRTTQFLYGTPTGVPWFVNAHSATGYLATKMTHRLSTMSMTGTSSSMHRYAFPVIRLADLYLMYSEVLNEVKDAPDSEVYHWIDLVRARTGLDGVVESWRDHSLNPNKPAGKDGMREIIHRERMIELAFEAQRYWDMRRWKKQKDYINNTPIEGWDIYHREVEGFYQVQTLATPVFEEKDYLWPMRQGNLLRNKNLIQNPGWD